MSDTAVPRAVAAVLVAAEPQLFVADIAASCAFFKSKLGFAVAFSHGEPAFYAQVRRDGAILNLRHVDRPPIDPALRDRDQLLTASLSVATPGEIEALFIEFQSAGVAFAQSLTSEPWGAKNFIVSDPDGNLLLFAGPGG